MKRFISTHSLVLALPMHIDHLPDRGAAVEASTAAARPGGGFIVLAAAAAQGVHAALASPLGTGPNSFTVRQHLEDAGVEILTTELVGDIGISIQLIESDGSTTSVLTSGVESEPNMVGLERVHVHEGDLVHISGIDLLSPEGGAVLAKWGASLPRGVRLVVSLSPAAEKVPVSAWRTLLPRADVVTMNIREKSTVDFILAAEPYQTSIRELMRDDAAIVRRLGVMGCEIQATADSPRVQIPAFHATLVDTAGVGDTHIATMCASLLKGYSLEEACLRANAASAITVAHESALPVPTQEEIDQVLEHGTIEHLNR